MLLTVHHVMGRINKGHDVNHDHQSPIRPECLRPADDLWAQPTGDEVREVLCRAGLTGAGAARVLGMKGATGRGIRRYTGDDVPIPYPSWAILCDLAGLGKIWAGSADLIHGGTQLMVDVDSMEWTETTEADFLSRLQKDESARDFVKLWRQRCNVGEHVRAIEDVINGSTPLNDAALADCRTGLMRLRQATYVLNRMANRGSWSGDAGPVIQAIAQRYTELMERSEANLLGIMEWAKLPS